MFDFLKKRKKKEVAPPAEVKPSMFDRAFKTHQVNALHKQMVIDSALNEMTQKGLEPFNAAKNVKGAAMDNQLNTKVISQGGSAIPQEQVYWYASQTFIGFQLMAMLSQQWLIKKCCLMPAKDAVRNGYEITKNDGTEIEPEIRDAIRRMDVDYRLNYNLIQFVDQGRVFGIRIAMFLVDSEDKDYYYKPFNPDGVMPGSYKGISQIDPYWISPQLDTESAGAPANIHFYEPTWWNIAGRLVHRSHLVIFRTEEVPDILKPVYIYSGVSIPQKIYDRVYAAERTANEAPLLALTKRTDVLKTDVAQALANEPEFTSRMKNWVDNRDNYAVKIVDLTEDVARIDTSLADLDAVIMTQYQLVAAAAEIPATKLLGTQPKGFNTTGEYEEASYHEMLESIQAHDLTPLIERHHLLLIRSEIAPKFGIEPFSTSTVWKPLDAMTAKELAEVNLLKAQAGNVLANSGAIDGMDERERIITDPESGYNGLDANAIISDPDEGENDWNAGKPDEEME